MTAEDFQAIADTCFYGVVYTTRAAVPVMRKQKSGHIFQVSSVGGRLGVPGNTPYHAVKWAVGGFSDSLAMEVAPFGVKICTLEPGGIRTNWARRAGENMPDLLPDYEASVGAIHKMLRGLEGRSEGDPRKIADVILQLANSDEVPLRLSSANCTAAFAAASSRTSSLTGFTRSPYCATRDASSSVRRERNGEVVIPDLWSKVGWSLTGTTSWSPH